VQFNSKRDNIANEVMTSEANYLRSLTIVNEVRTQDKTRQDKIILPT